MDILRNMIGFLLSISLGALGALMGGVLLVAIRVAASPRRRRQFHRLMNAGSGSFITAFRRVVNEAPDVADDTASRVSVRVS
jgi:uncharacterized membrane protein YeaQ/YmgE (transglycosylase-associated protein family)